MTELYFAYGTNLDPSGMRRRSRTAAAVGPATLRRWTLTFAASGWPTIRPDPAGCVHGLLWRVDAEALQALDEYEDVSGGLYQRVTLDVSDARGHIRPSHVYIANGTSEGPPRPGLVAQLIEAAEQVDLNDAARDLERFLRRE